MANSGLEPLENVTNQPSPQATSANNIFKHRKVFNDPIHGQIEIHPVCVRIIDTPQFQRLRHIKQLDTCYLVYPGASHNRFEHSLGVCHLAGKLLKTIRERQPDEQITDRDILCVEIAGLCHDLGQGPFSHVFEKKFMKLMKQKKRKGKEESEQTGTEEDEVEFTHELAARKMFEYMLTNNNGEVEKDIQKILADCKIPDFDKFKANDFIFIKEMIGVPKNIETGNWPYEGRDASKSFMYEIVANKRNGVDVDKWDYIARDSFMLGMKVNFDHNRCFASARVIKVNGMNGGNGTNGNNGSEETANESAVDNETRTEGNLNVYRKQICYREKEAQDLYDMFYTRMTLHRRAYQHKTHNLIGMMICDALEAANEDFRISEKKMSDTVDGDNMEAYTQLNDNVIQLILNSPINEKDPSSVSPEAENSKRSGVDRAKELLRNILNRKLYKCVGQTQVVRGNLPDEGEFKQQFNDILKKDELPIEEDYIGYDIVNLDYGLGNKDPMEKVRFYRKDDIHTAIKLTRTQVSYVLPDTFAEHIVRVYCKVTDAENHRIKRVKDAFSEWCKLYKHPLPKGERQRQGTNETQQQNIAGPELGSRRNSNEGLENKHLVEPELVATTEEQPGPYHAGGVEVRTEQPSDREQY